jgi:hypothetical protein
MRRSGYAVVCVTSRSMKIRVVSPVRGEVVEVTRDGIEVISEAPLAPGQKCALLMKRDFRARRLQGRVRWCIARPSVEIPFRSSPFSHQFYLEAREMDPAVQRFLMSQVVAS